MNDRPDLSSSDDETPEIAEVRRLLAEARHTDPIPDDVALRMNQTLERLPAEPAPRVGEVISISPQRRRRAAQLLVAAAAIVVGGVVVSQNLGSSGGGSATNAGAEAAPEKAPGFQSGDTANGAPQTPSATQDHQYSRDDGFDLSNGRLVIRSRHFASDVQQARAFLDKATTPTDRLAALTDCAVRQGSRSQALAAEYKRAPAALVFRRPEGGAQVVFLYVCGSSEPIKTTTLPAP